MIAMFLAACLTLYSIRLVKKRLEPLSHRFQIFYGAIYIIYKCILAKETAVFSGKSDIELGIGAYNATIYDWVV